jgi:putative membrane protein
MKSVTKTAAATAAAALATGSVLLIGTAVPAGAATAAATQDVAWAQATAQTDYAEIAIGQLAEQRAEHSDTKMMAQMTIGDHTKALASLKSVASQDGITLPTAPNAVQQSQAAQLKSVAAGQFDATYDAIQIKGHELSIGQTQTELANGSSTAVKDNAQAYLPVAEKHLQMAESDYTALGGSVSAVSAGTGGLAATNTDDAPWIAVGAAGALLLAGTGAFGLRRRISVRARSAAAEQ